jgi:hypothetical protein
MRENTNQTKKNQKGEEQPNRRSKRERKRDNQKGERQSIKRNQ